jgi:hypothetical protein
VKVTKPVNDMSSSARTCLLACLAEQSILHCDSQAVLINALG